MSPPQPPGTGGDVQRVLLVDDHALFREGMAGLLAYEDDLEVVGEAADAAAARFARDRGMMDVADAPVVDQGRAAQPRALSSDPTRWTRR